MTDEDDDRGVLDDLEHTIGIAEELLSMPDVPPDIREIVASGLDLLHRVHDTIEGE